MTPSLIRPTLLLSFSLLAACAGKGGDGEDDTGATLPVDEDGDGFSADEDCDDADAAVNPDAVEVCDGIDNDCDELVDGDDDSVDASSGGTWYADADADGFGDAADPGTAACEAPQGTVADNTDCDDADPAIHPDATEVCDDADVDEDCSGAADDADAGVDAATQTAWYMDADGDGFGDAADAGRLYCDAPPGVVLDATDCDDAASDVNPGATEVCDDADVDEDCSGAADDADPGVDAATQSTWYTDGDGDGYGDDTDAGALFCDAPSGVSLDNTDCDDGAAGVNPGATEVCDDADVDEDCSGAADDADAGVDASTQSTWYADADGDGYGDASDGGTPYCDEPSGVVLDNTDCDDTTDQINPGEAEVCDGLDNDCDASTSESGIAEFTDTVGTITDVSAALTGTSSAPAAYTLSTAGVLSLCEGTWYVQLDVDADASIAGYDAATTILSAGGQGSVVTIEGAGLSVDISGVTIQDGVGDGTDNYYTSQGGGGVQCYDDSGTSALMIWDAVVRDNDATIGGGVHAYGCDTTVLDSEFIDNTGEFGAAGFVAWPSFSMDGVDVSGGDAATSGGAFFVDGNQEAMTFDMDDTLLSDNVASFGGALYLWRAVTGTCTGTASTYAGIVSNTGDSSRGGGVHTSNFSGSFTATSCDFGTSAGGDDNSPSDVRLGTTDYTSYGDDATFTCSSTSCI